MGSGGSRSKSPNPRSAVQTQKRAEVLILLQLLANGVRDVRERDRRTKKKGVAPQERASSKHTTNM